MGVTLPVEIKLSTKTDNQNSSWEIWSGGEQVGKLFLRKFVLPKKLSFQIELTAADAELTKFLLLTISQTLLREPLRLPVIDVTGLDLVQFKTIFPKAVAIAQILDFSTNRGYPLPHELYDVSETMPMPFLSHQKPIYNTLINFLHEDFETSIITD